MPAGLRQDITTAADAGDEATADRLREELSAAIENADSGTDPGAPEHGAAPDLAGTGAAPQPPDAADRGTAEDPSAPPD
ncbi:hypothetical protein [Nocardia sp. NPDC057030]|uniref:hypothetical protein n=1 Tax=unclassified Nocardia TaxID=2637762 RepID=UPI00362B2999